MAFPKRLPAGFVDKFDKLDKAQVGHLRHFHNLATQLSWDKMGGQVPAQEWLDGYRYQLATMAYASGSAHYHRLPALRSVFRTLQDDLIQKMLKSEVWGYWYLTSQSGKFVDPDLEVMRKPWADPIKQENIMYSGHLLLMVSLYSMLFDDDKYDRKSALVFDWAPVFWGMGPERFEYSRSSLQNAILAEMERENWIGVCCEPNSVFVVCNQFPLIAIRYNDVRNKTDVSEVVLQKYLAAWRSKGMVQENGLFVNWYRPKQDDMVHAQGVGFSAWACAFMNSWNPDYVRTHFPKQIRGFLNHEASGRINLNKSEVAEAIRRLVAEDGGNPNSKLTAIRARELAAQSDVPAGPPSQPEYGYVIQAVSELCDTEILDGMLKHADMFLNPTWDNGGLFYSRNDILTDQDGNWTFVDPFTGNAGIGYARLNVRDGQRKMYENPWTATMLARTPYIEGVNLGSGVDYLRGVWDEKSGAMVVTMRTWNGTKQTVKPRFHNLPPANYGIYINDDLSYIEKIKFIGASFEVQLVVDGDGLDLVVLGSTAFDYGYVRHG